MTRPDVIVRDENLGLKIGIFRIYAAKQSKMLLLIMRVQMSQALFVSYENQFLDGTFEGGCTEKVEFFFGSFERTMKNIEQWRIMNIS